MEKAKNDYSFLIRKSLVIRPVGRLGGEIKTQLRDKS
jgi:hypothetical protein